MAQTPYEVLGVKPDASAEEIRKVYRKLAKEFHHDLNPGKPAAEERFKAVSVAYDLLSDPEKRGRYDRGEIDESGAERPPRSYYRGYAEAPRAGNTSPKAKWIWVISRICLPHSARAGAAGGHVAAKGFGRVAQTGCSR